MLSRLRTLTIAACLTITALPALRAQDARQQATPAFVSAKALAEQLGAEVTSIPGESAWPAIRSSPATRNR